MGVVCLSKRHAPRNDSLSRVGIVAALAAEARAISSVTGTPGVPQTLQDGTLLVVSGIGLMAAASAAASLLQAGASALMSFGLAGGLDPAVSAGRIFLPEQIVSGPKPVLATSCEWRERVASALQSQQPLVTGKLLSSSRAVATVEDKARAFRESGATAVDMESMAVAQIAAIRDLPFLAVRVIVDTAADVLPNAVLAASQAGEPRIWSLIGRLVLAPADLVAVIRLARRYGVANRALRAIAATGCLQESVN